MEFPRLGEIVVRLGSRKRPIYESTIEDTSLMVRLKSQRWYGNSGQRSSRNRAKTSVNASRRLLSLCFLLALILLLMKKAADPQYIERGFKALGVPLKTDFAEVVDPSNSAQSAQPLVSNDSKDSNLQSESTLDDQLWRITCQDLVPRLLKEVLAREESLALANAWFHYHSVAEQDWRNAEQDGEKLLDKFSNETTGKSDATEWIEPLTRFRGEWNQLWDEVGSRGQSGSPTESKLSSDFQKALNEYLDRQLLDALKDAAPWTKKERTGFWRLISRTRFTAKDTSSVATYSTQQLESEGASKKGTLVRFRCEVRSIEFVDKGNGTLGVDGYWLMWTRGADGSAQPVAIYSCQPLQVIHERLDEAAQKFPEIDVVGYSGKRLAYNAESGVRVAPTLFANHVAIRKAPRPIASARDRSEVRRDFGFAVVGGVILAVCILLPILRGWKTKSVRNLGTKKVVGWLLLGLSLQAGWVRPGWCQEKTETPPWAQFESSDAKIRKVIQARLQLAVADPNDLNGLKSYSEQGFSTSGGVENCILKVLRVMDQIGWRKALTAWDQEKLQVGEGTWCVVDFQGWVRSVQKLQLTDDQADWFRATEDVPLYALELSLNDLERTEQEEGEAGRIKVVCERVPQRWLQAKEINQPARVRGLQLALNGSELPMCLANRMQWFVDNVATDSLVPMLAQHERELGKTGWDLGWLDLARQKERHGKPLGFEESQGFLTLMNCVEQFNQPAGSDSIDDSPAVAPHEAIKTPKSAAGKRVQWLVRIVSGSLVQLSNPYQIEDLGADKYFQFDGFVDIGNRKFNYSLGNEVITFEREFPVTVVCKSPNDFVSQAAMQNGELSWELGQYAEVSGRFYRMWSYESELVEETSPGFRQNAPLVIGAKFVRAIPQRSKKTMPVVGWFGYALCMATLAFVGAIFYFVFHRDNRRKRRMR